MLFSDGILKQKGFWEQSGSFSQIIALFSRHLKHGLGDHAMILFGHCVQEAPSITKSKIWDCSLWGRNYVTGQILNCTYLR